MTTGFFKKAKKEFWFNATIPIVKILTVCFQHNQPLNSFTAIVYNTVNASR